MATQPRSARQRSSIPWSKRATDLMVSTVLLIVCAPLLLCIAVCLKCSGWLRPADRGSVLRSEIRYSAGQPFRCYKFRTMRQEVLAASPPTRSLVQAKQLEQDANCTKVGRWVKKWYLDELPQLYHVWRGDMSLVGPRPFRVEDYEEGARQHHVDLRTARAGLTGLLQIHKGVSTERSKHELEMEYIVNSRTLRPLQLWRYDLGIMLSTFRVLCQGKGI
jgi:lipopolysaccharide/colanic/teichoic acid biosynthesis glycosyltransferase